MNRPCRFEIRVEGHLTDRWAAWFDGMAIRQEPQGETVLSGCFVDQAALYGTLTRIHSLNLTLVSVNRQPESKQEKDAVRK